VCHLLTLNHTQDKIINTHPAAHTKAEKHIHGSFLYTHQYI
jgi:hypothetical protein